MNYIKIGSILLGVLNVLFGLLQLLYALITQLTLFFYSLMGILSFVMVVCFMKMNTKLRKLYFFAIAPIAGLAIWNTTLMGSPDMPEYFRMPPNAQFELIAALILIPTVINLIFLNIPALKSQFK